MEEISQKLNFFLINYSTKAKGTNYYINKTIAHYYKLENTAIKIIDYSTFVKVPNLITNTDKGYPTFMKSILENISDEKSSTFSITAKKFKTH